MVSPRSASASRSFRRIVQSLIERPSGAAEPVSEDVDRHLVQRQRDQHLTLVRSQARLDLLPDGRQELVHLDLPLWRRTRIRYAWPMLCLERELTPLPGELSDPRRRLVQSEL